MERKINVLSMTYILFLAILFLSGMFSGFLSEVIYLLAFLLPFVFALFVTRGEDENQRSMFSLDFEGIKLTFPIIIPTVVLVIVVSLLTSVIIEWLTGVRNAVNIGDSLAVALISHALLPAVLEEMLFRYLPMRFLSGYSKKVCILVSAIFFSLMHHNLFSIPYAFVAGVIFMAVDLMFDSLIPSILIHFLNNVLSILLIFFANRAGFIPVCIIVIAILFVLSLAFIIVRRKDYLEKLKGLFNKGEKLKFNVGILIFAIVCLFISIINLV